MRILVVNCGSSSLKFKLYDLGSAEAGILLAEGVVEEIGLTYTFIRLQDQARLVVPNEKLASDTIRNSTIRSREAFAEVSVPIPLSADLAAAVDELREEVAGERDAAVYVSSLDGNAMVTIRAAATNEDAAQELERDLLVRSHGRLRALGVWG